jgi:pre-mRNA-splicing factor CWC22
MDKLLEMGKNGFRDCTPIPEELDLVESDDQITFEISLEDEDIQKEEHLDVFSPDPDYSKNEQVWNKIRAEILGP